jgi:uncharacterized protein involved in exopolysaccharide biosynthesis
VRDDREDTGGTLADFMGFLWRHRVLIVGMVGIVTAITIVYVLVVPVEYTARATVIPQKHQTGGMFSLALAYLGGGGGSPIDISGLTGESALQEAILHSRRLADLMNEQFDLAGRYKASTRESRLRQWHSRLETASNRQGLLVVKYRDRDPEFASKVVSSLLEELDRFNREARTTTSRRVSEFLEQRVVEAEARLNAMEDSLAAYQAAHKTLALDPSAESVVALGGDLLVRRIQLITEARMLRETLGKGAPALRAKESEIDALDQELGRLPALNSDLSKLLRSRTVYQRTHAYLFAQLEESRIEEARDTPTIDILDAPVPPTEKSWPQRTWTVLIVFAASCLLALLLAKAEDAAQEVRRRLETAGA